MKREYIAPEMEIFNIEAGGILLAASEETDETTTEEITPEDWTGGGESA